MGYTLSIDGKNWSKARCHMERSTVLECHGTPLPDTENGNTIVYKRMIALPPHRNGKSKAETG